MSDIRSILTRTNNGLQEQYQNHYNTVSELQQTFLTQILPNVVTELELDEDQAEWAKQWLEDTGIYTVHYLLLFWLT
jgi:hypothetical protein